MSEAFTFVQLSDTHLEARPDAVAKGGKPYARLEEAIAHIRALAPKPAFVVLTGDLISDAPRAYAHVRALTDRLEVPRYFAVGNHDLRAPLRQALLDEPPSDAPLYYAFSHRGVRFVVLDSQVPGEIYGELDEGQLDWLCEILAEDGAARTLVLLHHPPVPLGIPWLDAHAVRNGEALLDALAEAPGVEAVLFGHVHMPLSAKVRGVWMLGCPSTAYPFGDAVNVPLHYEGPGAYRVVRVFEGGLSSWLMRFDVGR